MWHERAAWCQAADTNPGPLPIAMPGESCGPPPLDLTNAVNSHKVRAARGTHGLTSYARRMVRNACYLMEERYGKDRLGFLTLTVPPMSGEQAEELNTNWGEVLRVFFQRWDRKARAKGIIPHRIGVTEIQPKRAQATGFRWLHYHAVFLGRKKKGSWWVTPSWVRKAWTSAIRSAVPSFTGEACGENLQRVRRNPSAYLAKYMSKGGDVDGRGALPTAWWNTSTVTRKWVKGLVLKGPVTAQYLQLVVDCAMEGDDSAIEWLYPIVLLDDGGDGFLCGFTGKLRRSAMGFVG